MGVTTSQDSEVDGVSRCIFQKSLQVQHDFVSMQTLYIRLVGYAGHVKFEFERLCCTSGALEDQESTSV